MLSRNYVLYTIFQRSVETTIYNITTLSRNYYIQYYNAQSKLLPPTLFRQHDPQHGIASRRILRNPLLQKIWSRHVVAGEYRGLML
jgi:hypothetical protein